MKKWPLFILMLSFMLLSACSLIEKATNSLDYVNQATEHINNLSNFAEKAPQMIKDAATNPETKQELENRLTALKKEIEQFNLLHAPSLAKDIHQQLVDKNQIILQEINNVVENGHLALDKLQNSKILTTINEIAGLIDRIKSLGL
jgi:hypothetical protein